LPGLQWIKAEAADFDAYVGGARLHDLQGFLEPYGFVEHRRFRFARRAAGGSYFEIVWTRAGSRARAGSHS
jgi:hypothetical protein